MAKNYQSIRIFKSDFWEKTTHVHPIVPLIIWGPLVIFFYYRAWKLDELSYLNWFLCCFSGLLVWTLVEYLFHRYIFHFPARSKWTKRLVFVFHGLHHDDPNDPTRLVMPPVPALLFIILFYLFFRYLFFNGLFSTNYFLSFFASFISGYLIYDYIHYATHHFKMKNSVAKFLKRYHLLHHHQHKPTRYGVSSPLWDYIFGTTGKKTNK